MLSRLLNYLALPTASSIPAPFPPVLGREDLSRLFHVVMGHLVIEHSKLSAANACSDSLVASSILPLAFLASMIG